MCCFILTVFLINVLLLLVFCLLPWVGLQCVFVEFPDHTTSFAVILITKRNLVALFQLLS